MLMRLLLTNDDGIASPGLHALGAHLFKLGYDLVVAAPDHDMSGASAAIGRLHADEHIDVKRSPIHSKVRNGAGCAGQCRCWQGW